MSNVKSNKKNNCKTRHYDRGRPLFYAAHHNSQPHRVGGLFEFVYNSGTAFLVAVFLVTSFLLQGVYVVHASSENEAIVAIETPPATPPDVSLQPSGSDSEEILSSSEAVADESVTETPDNDVVENLIDSALANPPPPEETGGDVVDTDVISPEEMLLVVSDAEFSSTTEPESSGTPAPDVNAEDSDSETVITDTPVASTSDSVPATESASSTDGSDVSGVESAVIGPGLTDPITTTYSDSGYTFSKSECTELASGSFYCMEPRQDVLEDALFAAPDADGDLEIFLVRDNVQTQITDNLVDDAAPYYDQNSRSIVWHRLIDDRYQIVSYDLETAAESILTQNTTNDMEPTRQGKYTVWQRWVGNNWDIILHDGSKEVQITHSASHDIAPYIHGSLVVWNRYTMSGEKTVEMYDLSTETYVTVDDPAGLSVSNPRMVLVYDQLHPNGDIITKGYDMIARTFIALDTLPRELPDEVPGSEPTPETRALIQVKPTVKGDEVIEGDGEGDGVPIPPVDLDVSSSSDPLTLDLSAPVTVVPGTNESGANLTDFDLVIEPFSGTEGGVQATSS